MLRTWININGHYFYKFKLGSFFIFRPVVLYPTLCVVVLALAGGCVMQAGKNIFLQSGGEILESVRLLTKLDGGTRLNDYEHIF